MMMREKLLLTLSYILHYVISAGYLYLAWDWPMENGLTSLLSLKNEDETLATYYFIFFLILVPSISSTYNARKKFIDDRDSHIEIKDSGVFIFLAVISFLHAIGIVVCTGLMLATDTAIGLGFITVFFAYLFGALSVYKSRDYTWPTALKISNGILLAGIFLFVVIYAGVDIHFSKYAAVSAALLVCGFMLFIFSVILFNRDEE
jgi:peptidoglycan/LPS O-acetylase OafA/YrhL